MKKFLLTLLIIFAVIALFFTVDMISVKNKNRPIFVIKTKTYDDNNVRYTGLGYHVYHVKALLVDTGLTDYGYHMRFWFTDDISEVKKQIIKGETGFIDNHQNALALIA